MTRVVRRLTIGTVLLATVAGPLGPGASASSTGTVPTVITMQRPQINVSAGTVTLRGVLYRKGYPSARIRTGIVYLQRSSGGTRVWTNVGVTRTSSTGSYAFTVATPAPFMYRARFAGSPTFAPSVSGFVGVPGRFRIFLASFTQSDIDYETPPWPTPGYTLSSWLTATGRISPAVRITNAWIQRYNDATRNGNSRPTGSSRSRETVSPSGAPLHPDPASSASSSPRRAGRGTARRREPFRGRCIGQST